MWMSGEVTSIPSFTRSGRPSCKLRLEAALGKDVDGVPREVSTMPMGATLPSALALLRNRNRPPKRRRIRKLRLLALLVVLALLGASAFTFGLLTAVAAQISALDPYHQQPDAAEHRRLRERRAHGARGPPRLAGARDRPVGGHLPARQAGDRRDRGQALLRAPRRRRPRHPPRPLVRPHRRARRRAARRSRSSSSRTRSTATRRR